MFRQHHFRIGDGRVGGIGEANVVQQRLDFLGIIVVVEGAPGSFHVLSVAGSTWRRKQISIRSRIPILTSLLVTCLLDDRSAAAGA